MCLIGWLSDNKEHTIFYGLYASFVFLGIALAFRKKYSWLSLIPLLPFIYFLLITVLIMGVPRTRLPIEPYLIIFMALYINYLYNNYFKLGVTFVLSSWYILNLLLYVNSGYSKLFLRLWRKNRNMVIS